MEKFWNDFKSAYLRHLTAINFSWMIIGWIFISGVIVRLSERPLQTLKLSNNDDYTRMNRVFEYIDGLSVNSYFAPRVGPEGAELNWSRLVDWPLAGLQMFFEQFFERYEAAAWTASVYPAFFLFVLIAVCCWYVRPFTGKALSAVAIIAVLINLTVLRQFLPGRVDHHMLQVLLVLGAFGCLARVYLMPDKHILPIIAGICFAFGLAIGADAVLWLALASAFIGIFWLLDGSHFERPAFYFGASAFIGTFFLYLVIPPYDRFWEPICESLSPVFIYLTGAVFLFWTAVKFLPATLKNHFFKRFIVGGVCAVIVFSILYSLVSSCFIDPYQLQNQEIKEIWLKDIMEATPITRMMAIFPAFAVAVIVPGAISLISSFNGIFAEPERRTFWISMTIILAIGSLLAFHQIRTTEYTQMIGVIALTKGMIWFIPFFKDDARYIAEQYHKLKQGTRIALLLVFCLCMVFVIYQSAVKKSAQPDPQTDVAAEENISDDDKICDEQALGYFLRRYETPQTVVSYTDEGPNIVYWTKHRALAAPYHRNETGILTGYRVLMAENAEDALPYFEEFDIDIVLVCTRHPSPWIRNHEEPLRKELLKKLIEEDVANAEMELKEIEIPMEDKVFGRELLDGIYPDWLSKETPEPVGGYLIYKRKKP